VGSNRTSRTLERFFRSYLASCIASCPKALKVAYIPAKSISRDVVELQSHTYASDTTGVRLPSLEIEVVDPEFYTRVIGYSNPKEAFSVEGQCVGDAADKTSRRALVSDLALLEILTEPLNTEHTKEKQNLRAPVSTNLWHLQNAVRWLRGDPSASFMEAFVFHTSTDQSSYFVYASTVITHFIVAKYCFGSQSLLQIYLLVCAVLVRWLVLEAVLTSL
jgi:hypothetical protein